MEHQSPKPPVSVAVVDRRGPKKPLFETCDLPAETANFDWEAFGEVHELHNQVQSQKETIVEKEDIIEKLQDALVTLKEEIDFLEKQPVQSVAKDLAKKNHTLRLQSSRERDRALILEREKVQIQKELEELRSEIQSKTTVKSSAEEEWKTKFSRAQDRLGKMRVELSQSEIYCKKLKAALKKEIGKDVDVHSILSEDSKWKGRSELVARLKDQLKAKTEQVKRLKLQSLESARDMHENLSPAEQKKAARLLQNSVIQLERELTADRHTLRVQNHIQKTADLRRKEMETLREELASKNEMYQRLKEKYDAQNSRVQTLEHSSRDIREKVKIILDKSETDDKLIESLKSKLKQEKRLRVQASKKVKQNEVDTTRHEQYESKVEALKQELKKHQEENEMLSQEIVRLSNSRSEEMSHLLQEISSTQQSYETEFYKSENQSLKDQIIMYKQRHTALGNIESKMRQPRRNSKVNAEFNARIKQLREVNTAQKQELEICYQMLNHQRFTHDSAMNEIAQKFQEIQNILEQL